MFFIFYFIDADTFYLFLNWFSTRVSDDRKYVCGRRLCACMNTRKFKGIDSRAITSLPDIEKVIYMAHLFNHRRKLFAYSESLQRPTIAILLIQILIFFFEHSVVFLCYKVLQSFQAIELIPYFSPEALKPGAWPRRVASCYGTYTVVGVNIKREMVLSPNDEEVANSSKKHTQFKTRVHKPYPISDQNGRNWYPISDQNS